MRIFKSKNSRSDCGKERKMIDPLVGAWAAIMLAISLSVSGCTNAAVNVSSGKGTEQTSVNNGNQTDTGKDIDNTNDQKSGDQNSDEISNNPNGDQQNNESGENQGTVEVDQPDVTDAPEMDYITMMEYDRSRLLSKKDYYNTLDNHNDQTWCFQRKKDHSQSGTYESFKITDYNGVYVNTKVSDDDKVIYLTFDCGYPSDLTVKILDTLKKHNAKGSFFVTKMYLEECADYAKRMKEEGHMVCNHTVTHTDLVTKDVDRVVSEIIDVAEYFYEVTGYTFDPYLRTPTGSYTKKLMTIIEDAGYMTVFWSIAYGDYDPKNQPAPGYVTDHFQTYHHNGAIALMHNDSPSNANELDAVLTLLEKEGYRFGLLDELWPCVNDPE